MVREEDTIAVALSGGKDSTLTLYTLHELSEGYGFNVIAISIDEGIKGYRDESLKVARENTASLGVEHHVVAFKEAVGMTLDEIVKKVLPLDVEPRSACTYCGVFRRRLINVKARELGANKVATGHNLDDEIQTILMNFLRGDFQSVLRLSQTAPSDLLVKRIKPLSILFEKEIAAYVLLEEIPVYFGECPYAQAGLRSLVRDQLNEMESKHPGSKLNFYSFIRGTLAQPQIKYPRAVLGRCSICGEPTPNVVCKFCELLKRLREK